MSSGARPRPGSPPGRRGRGSCHARRPPAAAPARGGRWSRGQRRAAAPGPLARELRGLCRSASSCTSRPTIATGRGHDSGRLANAEKSFGRARRPRPYTATANEADLPAEEAQAGQDPRLPGADEHPGGSRDPQPAPPQRPEAPDAIAMPKRRRLSRSGEFDRVYRDGSSHATRYLVLYSFPRRGEEARTPRSGSASRQAAKSAAPSSGIGSSGFCAKRSGRRPTASRTGTTSSSSPARKSAS